MMKKYRKVIFIFLLIIFPTFVKADCQSDYDTIKSSFKATYKYNENDNSFDITFVTPNYNRYLFKLESAEDVRNAEYITLGNQMTINIKNHKGTEYKYEIIGEYPECKNVSVFGSKLILKEYNQYADNDLCKGNEEFVLCQKEYDGDIDEETFKSRIEAYIEEKSNKEIYTTTKSNSNESLNKDTDIIEEVLEFTTENKIVLITIIIIILALIFFAVKMIKKSIKSRRLE